MEGNLHLIFNQSFKTSDEVKRFEGLMFDICENVAVKHGGSLKAEHGTGRNVAPFVEMEWGTRAYVGEVRRGSAKLTSCFRRGWLIWRRALAL